MTRERVDQSMWRAVAHDATAKQYVISGAGTVIDGVFIPEWALVMRFYTAIHVVNAYLFTKKVEFTFYSHDQRRKALQSLPETSGPKAYGFNTAWKRLQSVSEQVRYDPGYRAQLADMENTRVDLDRVLSYLGTKVAGWLKDN